MTQCDILVYINPLEWCLDVSHPVSLEIISRVSTNVNYLDSMMSLNNFKVLYSTFNCAVSISYMVSLYNELKSLILSGPSESFLDLVWAYIMLLTGSDFSVPSTDISSVLWETVTSENVSLSELEVVTISFILAHAFQGEYCDKENMKSHMIPSLGKFMNSRVPLDSYINHGASQVASLCFKMRLLRNCYECDVRDTRSPEIGCVFNPETRKTVQTWFSNPIRYQEELTNYFDHIQNLDGCDFLSKEYIEHEKKEFLHISPSGLDKLQALFVQLNI
eukprot:TRINITY_DN199_c0_g2_i1.p1 TRINITY_DN199_c0_g2~~TRINITY_DN199_c0_g2_i1.p1  ORF type:complete len:292 (+),score=46.66 TRINITY_DN199_c0_g2_i1:51-878(+)